MSNYPDGVRERDIPGFRPQDEALQRAVESIDDDGMLDFIIDKDYDCAGCVIVERDEQGFSLEADSPEVPWPHEVVKAKSGRTWVELLFATREDALAYATVFHYSEIEEQMIEEIAEGQADDYYGGW